MKNLLLLLSLFLTLSACKENVEPDVRYYFEYEAFIGSEESPAAIIIEDERGIVIFQSTIDPKESGLSELIAGISPNKILIIIVASIDPYYELDLRMRPEGSSLQEFSGIFGVGRYEINYSTERFFLFEGPSRPTGGPTGGGAGVGDGNDCGPLGETLYQGPRGGCYYINANGNKSYVERSCCG